MFPRSRRPSRRSFTHIVVAMALAAFVAMPGSAFADHPETDDMQVVQQVAHDLEEAATYVHRLAERHEHHYDPREERALRALHELEEAAEDFHRQVERYRQNPYKTERYYQTLERCYVDAYRAFFGLHAFRSVERAFYRVEDQMNDLRYYYDPPRDDHYGRDHGYRGHGEYRGHGQYRRYGQYQRHGRYRGSSQPEPRYHRGAHYRGCGHER